MASKGTRAVDEVVRAGVPHTVHEYETATPAERRSRPRSAARCEADEPATYGEAAAAALGVDPRRVFKTLIASVDGRLAAAIVPVDLELDLKRFAEALDGRRAELAAPAEAERATGYVVGGISPLGQRRRLATVLDTSAASFGTVLVSAGRRGLQLELAPADLARLSGAVVAPIARG